MSDLPLHPMVVHFPLVLALLLPVASLVVLYFVWRDKSPAPLLRALAVGFVLLFGSAFAATQTGEIDEHAVEDVVGKDPVHHHEEGAELFFYGTIGALVLAGAGAVFATRRKAALPLAAATTAVAIVVAFFALEVGHSGGQIIYVHGGAAAHLKGKAATGTEAAPGTRRGTDQGTREDHEETQPTPPPPLQPPAG